jgi:hypothetical protein
MNLKDNRFGIDMDAMFDYYDQGSYIRCIDIIAWVEYQRQQFGMNSDRILELMTKELK